MNIIHCHSMQNWSLSSSAFMPMIFFSEAIRLLYSDFFISAFSFLELVCKIAVLVRFSAFKASSRLLSTSFFQCCSFSFSLFCKSSAFFSSKSLSFSFSISSACCATFNLSICSSERSSCIISVKSEFATDSF